MKLHHLLTVIATSLLLFACTSTPPQFPKSLTTSIEAGSESSIGAALESGLELHPGQSGFYLLTDALEALATRILLIENAERGVDAQYYFILGDETGYLFIQSLLEAADRGVRVRLLVDDIQTMGYDTGIAVMDSHPNFEIRIFNPFSRKKGRLLDAATNFQRVNRRMHNKSLTVDGLATVVGGRNIGAEYFGARPDVNFGDLDVAGFGPVAREVDHVFDIYWNSEFAVPASAMLPPLDDPEAEMAALRERIAAHAGKIGGTDYHHAIGSSAEGLLAKTVDDLIWADYEVVYDEPDKMRNEKRNPGLRIRDALADEIHASETELLLISPYFGPMKEGVGLFRELRVERMCERAVELCGGVGRRECPRTRDVEETPAAELLLRALPEDIHVAEVSRRQVDRPGEAGVADERRNSLRHADGGRPTAQVVEQHRAVEVSRLDLRRDAEVLRLAAQEQRRHTAHELAQGAPGRRALALVQAQVGGRGFT